MTQRRGIRGSRSRAHNRPQQNTHPSGQDPTTTLPVSELEKARNETDTRLRAWLGSDSSSGRSQISQQGFAINGLDAWQKEVFDGLMAGASVVVDAPTSAGKTRAVEAYFAAQLESPGFRACYTTPVKSLANDKVKEFRLMFGDDKVGIATGDIKENLGAPIVVATLESYRNSLLGVEPDLSRTLAVFDEYHYIQDQGRGSAWEEALILSPAHCQLLLLSASVENAEEFTSWLKKTGQSPGDSRERRVILVRTTHRPVPLESLVWFRGDWFAPDTIPEPELKRTEQKSHLIDNPPMRQEDLLPALKKALERGLTPAILYCGRRISTETLARLLGRELPPLSEPEAERIGEVLERCHQDFKALAFITPDIRQLLQVKGVGFHHSGLAAPARMAIEALVKAGLLRYCTATMGLSLGINFAVRSTMITDQKRPSESGLTPYDSSEILQMLGRAGRRGKDPVGFSLWPSLHVWREFGGAKRAAITSRLRIDPTTFLGLVGKGLRFTEISRVYSQSLRRFQDQTSDFSLLEPSSWDCDSPLEPLVSKKPAAALQLHLYRLGALDHHGQLSLFGSIARYFPQNGGLLIAQRLSRGEYGQDELMRLAELAGILSLARFKEPRIADTYRPPLDLHATLDELERLYPLPLFSEMYDMPLRGKGTPTLREFNPAGGYLVRQWLAGTPWRELASAVTTEHFGTGDLMAVLYRAATFLQSIVQAGITDLSTPAANMRGMILREPLSLL